MSNLNILFYIVMAMMVAACKQIPVSTTVTVLEENGLPIDDANVTMGFSNNDQKSGLTDDQGRFRFSGTTDGGLGIKVSKDGYYQTTGELWIGNKSEPIPPSEFKVTLKQVIQPVPMYHRKIETEFPRLGRPIGFDLEKGDWVVPYGNGVNADLLFEATRDMRGKRDYSSTLTVTFINSMDGYQEFYAARPFSLKLSSELPSPQIAPADGYRDELHLKRERNPNSPFVDYKKEDRNYLFRVRSETDNNGNIVKTCYGRTLGEIEFSPLYSQDVVWLKFEYFFNPDLESTSLEYDGNNLTDKS